ncbi:MAG: AAA family ATPase [Planctomycetota bacterium]
MPIIDALAMNRNAGIGEQNGQGATGALHNNLHDAGDGNGNKLAVALPVGLSPTMELHDQSQQPAPLRSVEELARERGEAHRAALTPESQAAQDRAAEAVRQAAAQANTIADSEFEALLLYCRVFPEVLTASKQLLDESHFCGLTESNYQRLWKYFIAQDRLPEYERTSAEIETAIANKPQLPGNSAAAIHRDAHSLLRWLYSLDFEGFPGATPPQDPKEGLRLLAKVARVRAYDEPMKRLLEREWSPWRAENEAKLQEKRKQIEELCNPAADTEVSLEELVSGTYTHNWLIKNVLIEGSPAIVGGPKKALKTSILLDLAVSLGIGEGVMFLNHHRFRVEKRVAVGMYSGESNQPTVATTVRNILASKNRKPAESAVYLQFATPKLSDDGDIATVTAFIKRQNLKVIIFDPAYTSLLKGNTKASASNVFDMGAVLSKISEACLAAGATPIFAHHTVKNAGMKAGRNGTSYKSYEPAELGDLAFAGFGEFARQWLLLARREDYEPGTGKHQLWLTTGGSAGFNGSYALDVDEGVMREDFGGKKWDVTVNTQGEAAHGQVKAKVDAAALREQEDRQKVLNALGEHGGCEGITLTKLMDHISMRRPTVQRHLAALSESRQAEICGEFKRGSKWRCSSWNQG